MEAAWDIKGMQWTAKSKKEKKNLQKNIPFFMHASSPWPCCQCSKDVVWWEPEVGVEKRTWIPEFFKSQFIFFYCMWTWVNFISPYYKIGIDVCEFDFPQLRQPTLDIVIYYYIIIIAKCKCAPGLTMKCSFVPLLFFFCVCHKSLLKDRISSRTLLPN